MEKIEKYIACQILMIIMDFPSNEDYWNNNPFLSKAVSIMLYDIIININQFIHPECAYSKGNKKY